jgi:hypothetical protein
MRFSRLLKKKTLLSAGILPLLLFSVAFAEGKIDLDQLEKMTSIQLESKLPGWRHKRLERGASSNVLVQSWGSTNRSVMVVFIIHETAEGAKKEVRSFLQFKREPEELKGFGDEAFATDIYNSTIIMRRGRYVIYSSIVAHIEDDADAQNLSQIEQQTYWKNEIQKVGKLFVKELSLIE